MKIDITGTQGEVSFVAPDGKVVSANSPMDEIAVGITLSGDHPIVLVFEDLKDIALFRLDLGVVQAEELAGALLQVVQMRRADEARQSIGRVRL